MRLVNFHYFYNLAKSLQPLSNLQEDASIFDNWQKLYPAEVALREFLVNDLLPPEACNETGQMLVRLLDQLTSNIARDEPITAFEIQAIHGALNRFETLLEGEYRIKIVFALSKKGLYALNQLAYNGEELVEPYVLELVPEMKQDLKDAGRCVAFEVPTAAAFHLFRATEATAKAYILAVRGTPVTAKEKNKGLGGYKAILESLKVDDRILNALEQLVKLHRNPTIHPDVHVTNEEVRATLGMVESVISVMALDMRRRKETPTIPLDALLPPPSEEAKP